MSQHTHPHGNALSKGGDVSKVMPILKEWVREVKRRFRNLRGRVRDRIDYPTDALYLRPGKKPPILANQEEPYDFPTEESRIDAFIEDLKAWFAADVLEPVNPIEVQNGDHWTSEYIRNAYVKAQNVATGRMMQEGVSLKAQAPQEILETRTSVRTLKNIYTRAYEDLEAITEDMADTIRKDLTQAYAKGWNPRKTADKLTKDIRSIQHQRAEAIAQTETINTAAESTLNRMEDADVTVGMHGDWLHSFDTNVCDFCRALGGTALSIDEMRSTRVMFRGQVYRLRPAAHTRGRCSIGVIPGLSEDDLPPLRERLDDEMTRVSGG